MAHEIHGHAVLDRVIGSGRLFTRETLVAFIETEFGAAARFHTCSADGMDAAALVAFLAARGKFAGPDAGFTVDPQRVCRH